MTLDLYYNNFGSIGTSLETLYQSFLVEDMGEKAETEKNPKSPKENGRVHKSFEKNAPNLKLQIKPDATLAHKNLAASPPTSNEKNRRREKSAPPSRFATNSRQQKTPKSPQKTVQQNENTFRSQRPARPVSASPQFRSYAASSRLSPQEIRNKKSHPSSESAENSRIPSHINANDENIHQNSQNSSMQTTPKNKSSSKVYFLVENVENLTYNGESAIDDSDPDASTSPKVNPYSNSFLNFLKTT